jgi:simple sugar transport system permease protein
MNLRSRLRSTLTMMGSRASFTRLLIVAALIVLTFSVLSPGVFLSPSNLQFLALSVPELALLSLAVAVAMLTGGIDLSIVAVANMAGIVAALLMQGGTGPGAVIFGITGGMLAAIACGLLNGIIISALRVTPILATLGTSQLIAGISLVLSDGSVITGLPADFSAIATATLGGIPVIFLIMVGTAILLALVIARTALGVRMRLLGANPTAALFSGIQIRRVTLTTYAISAGLAGIAGLMITARASGANSEYGASYLLLAIVVAVLAGVNPDGGYITVAGVVIAALALQLLSSGLLGIQVSSHLVSIAQGLLLILMMALNYYGDRLRGVRIRRAKLGVA